MNLTASTTVRKEPREVYDFWRQIDKFPMFMTHVDEITVVDNQRSHWKVNAPFDKTVEWDAVITQDEPGEILSWKSDEGADIGNEGSVRFVRAPGDQGTEVHVSLAYDMPAGKAGELIARIAGEDPHQQLDDDMRRFKQIVETGEIVASDGAPNGKQARKEFPQRPAQPMSDEEMREVKS